jgi:hypothetical protein
MTNKIVTVENMGGGDGYVASEEAGTGTGIVVQGVAAVDTGNGKCQHTGGNEGATWGRGERMSRES